MTLIYFVINKFGFLKRISKMCPPYWSRNDLENCIIGLVVTVIVLAVLLIIAIALVIGFGVAWGALHNAINSN